MTVYKRGQVVLVPFPFTDLTSVKQRPALVVSADQFNASRQDVILAAITSQVPPQPANDELLVPAIELAQWGLPKPSVLKLTKLFTIHQGLICKSLGKSNPATLGIILRLIQKQFEP